MPQSSRTTSRNRARDAISCNWPTIASGSTRSLQATSGRRRRASRSSPAAFWARAPVWRSAGSSGRPSALACWRAAMAARTICSGLSRKCIIPSAGSSRRWPSPSRAPSQSRLRSSIEGTGASTITGTPRDHAGSQAREPTSTTGQDASAKARTATAPRSASTSTGPQTSPAPASRASRAATAAISTTSSPGPSLPRSRASARDPAASSAADAMASPADPKPSRTYQRRTPSRCDRTIDPVAPRSSRATSLRTVAT